MLHLSPHELVAPPLPSNSGGKCHSSAKRHLSYGCKWESGRRDDGSDGQAQPSPPGWFIKRLSASGALRLDWKAPAGQRINLHLKCADIRCSWSRRQRMKQTEVIGVADCFRVSPPSCYWAFFIKGKWNSTIFKAKRDPQLLLMLNGLFSCVPITANTAILLLERCVHVLMGSFLGQTADREAN